MTIFKPYIAQKFPGTIWKLVIDPTKELLYIELRDAEKREVSFWGFNLETGQNTFNNLSLDEKWLTGIDGCFDGVMLLHGYQSAQSPAHKGITAINGLTGAILWSNYTYAIQHISLRGPVAYNAQVQPPKLFILDAQNGATLHAFNPSVDADMEPGITLPGFIEMPGDDIKRYIKGQITGNIHYIEHNSFRIVSLHALDNGKLSQALLILQGGQLVYNDLLNDGIQKLQPEAFIMHGSRLIYIKNKVELKVLNL